MTDKAIIRKWLPGKGEVPDMAGEAWLYDKVKSVPVNPIAGPRVELTRCLRELFSQIIGFLRSIRVEFLSNFSRSLK